MKKTIKLLLITTAISGLAGCYYGFQDGGNIINYYSKLIGKWTFDEYYLDGKVMSPPISSYTETYNDDDAETCIFSYKLEDGTKYSDTGYFYTSMYISDSIKDVEMRIDSIELKDFLGKGQSIMPNDIKILRLTKHDFWYAYYYNGHDHEFHLKKLY